MKVNLGESVRNSKAKIHFRRGIIETLNFIIRTCVSLP